MFKKELLLNLGIVKDNSYLLKYEQLINKNIDNKSIKFITQRHHAIPRSYFRHYHLSENTTDNVIVNLTYSDHILAHYYLFKCSVGWFKYSCRTAFVYLVKLNKNRVDCNISDKLLEEMIPDLVSIREQCNKAEHLKNKGGKWN